MKSILIFVLALSQVTAMAATKKSRASNSPAPSNESYIPAYSSSQSKRAQFFGGLNFFQYDYSEKLEDPKLKSDERGVVPGFSMAGLVYLIPEHESLAIRGALDFSSGNTTYDGTTQSGDPLPKMKTRNKLFNIESDIVGNLVTVRSGSQYIKGYTGIGYHSWTRDIAGDAGYREEYSWAYIPLGLRYENTIDNHWGFAVDASIRPMVTGNIIIHDSANGNLSMDLGQKPAYRLQVPVNYQIDKRVSFMFMPWMEFSSIGKSNSVDILFEGRKGFMYEPDSRTQQFGTMIGMSVTI